MKPWKTSSRARPAVRGSGGLTARNGGAGPACLVDADGAQGAGANQCAYGPGSAPQEDRSGFHGQEARPARMPGESLVSSTWLR
jgi:hypothetical protein